MQGLQSRNTEINVYMGLTGKTKRVFLKGDLRKFQIRQIL
jgi:hypothetical protein